MITKQKGQFRVFFHYFKQRDQWSVHFKQSCYVVEDLECQVPVEGHKQKTQPRRIMRGFASSVTIVNNKAIIR